MLPFLKSRKMSSVIIAGRKKDGSAAPVEQPADVHPELMSAAEKMVSAVHAKDATAVAEAMKMAHNHLNPKNTESENVEE